MKGRSTARSDLTTSLKCAAHSAHGYMRVRMFTCGGVCDAQLSLCTDAQENYVVKKTICVVVVVVVSSWCGLTRSFASFCCCLLGESGNCAASVWRKVHVLLPSSSREMALPPEVCDAQRGGPNV